MCHAVWRRAARRLLSGKGRVAMTVNRMNNRMGRSGNAGEVILVDEGKYLAGLGGDKRRCHVRAINIHLRRNCWLSQDRNAACVLRFHISIGLTLRCPEPEISKAPCPASGLVVNFITYKFGAPLYFVFDNAVELSTSTSVHKQTGEIPGLWGCCRAPERQETLALMISTFPTRNFQNPVRNYRCQEKVSSECVSRHVLRLLNWWLN